MLRDGELQGVADVNVNPRREVLTKRKLGRSTMLRATKDEGDKRSQPLVALRGRQGKELYKHIKANMHDYEPSHQVAAGAIMSCDDNMN